MIYVFKITSEEKETFIREIKIREDQTFLDFHKELQRSVGYDNSQIASFYIKNDEGEREKEIALFEMSNEEEEYDNVLVMDVTTVREMVNEYSKYLMYVYDFFSDRYFDVEFTGKEQEDKSHNYPICTLSEGDVPQQIFLEDMDSLEGMSDMGLYDNSDYGVSGTDIDDEDDEDIKFENLDDYTNLL